MKNREGSGERFKILSLNLWNLSLEKQKRKKITCYFIIYKKKNEKVGLT